MTAATVSDPEGNPMQTPISCAIPALEPFDDAVGHAQLADELGYDSIMLSHIAARDSFTMAAALAVRTQRVAIGTSVAPLYHRSPASMAQTAATVDDISGGRFRLGLGVGHRITMGGWHGQQIGKPTAEMREYIGIVRAILAGDVPPTGKRWTSNFSFMGFTARPNIPIYQAALSPAMLRLAGEIADGVVLWAGVRSELHRYFGLPFYRAMFQAAGFADDVAAFDAASPDVEAQKLAISERFIDHLCAIGDDAAVRDGVQRYRDAGVTNPVLTAILGTDFEPTLRAAAAHEPSAR
jgi:alkanesulfonate monooxygenase SsuD/methylene tetrahydromethanopterin reductase-like flavin-dependent oxidoreductase (luciferase family)